MTHQYKQFDVGYNCDIHQHQIFLCLLMIVIFFQSYYRTSQYPSGINM